MHVFDVHVDKSMGFSDKPDAELAQQQQTLPPPSPLLNASRLPAIEVRMKKVLQDHDRPIYTTSFPENAAVIFETELRPLGMEHDKWGCFIQH